MNEFTGYEGHRVNLRNVGRIECECGHWIATWFILPEIGSRLWLKAESAHRQHVLAAEVTE
jgi:hypothetical protein